VEVDFGGDATQITKLLKELVYAKYYLPQIDQYALLQHLKKMKDIADWIAFDCV